LPWALAAARLIADKEVSFADADNAGVPTDCPWAVVVHKQAQMIDSGNGACRCILEFSCRLSLSCKITLAVILQAVAGDKAIDLIGSGCCQSSDWG
jgi:hypothetical protein